jgi:hypothetical protein
MIIAVEQSAEQNSAYRHQMKGVFGNEGALPLLFDAISD